jgi:hypothetical protein
MRMSVISAYVVKYIRTIELIGVLMRVFSFSLVSWLGRRVLFSSSGYSTPQTR